MRRAWSYTQRGITLIELLVVMAVIAVLATITYGGMTSGRGGEGVDGVSSMLANLVRQARHTAMSSGAPVELRLHGDEDSGYRISGITQITIHGEQFEDSNTLGVGDPPLGYAGYGYDLSHITAVNLPPRPPLLRRADQDSFLLECMVKPPATAMHNEDGTALSDDQARIFPVALRSGGTFIGYISLQQMAGSNAQVARWQPQAVITTGGDDAIAIGPVLAGGEYVRLGLLYEGRRGRVSLLVNGVQDNAWRATGQIIPPGSSIELVYGDGYLDENEAPTPPDYAGILDNVRLYRLGDDSAFTLPRNIIPDANYRLLVHPDGSVEGDLTWRFRADFGGENPPRSTVTIQANGQVSRSSSF